MRKWLYEKFSALFWFVLAIYLLIWCTVSYMGVKVTYVAGPILLISGIVMYLSRPNPNAGKD